MSDFNNHSTPRAVSVADDSDTEFNPTPLHSPGGPGYDDLPPSYDEAQEQAVHDARNGVTPIDPSQLEAHRLTLDEGPDQPEVWEYRVRCEEPDIRDEPEQAPGYEVPSYGSATIVPIQHVNITENIPVGHVRSTPASSTINTMLDRALEFAIHEPDADVEHAPRLLRCIAIPQGDSTSSGDYVQFLRSFAKPLHTHSIRPGEFVEFLDGLNILCKATYTTATDILHGSQQVGSTASIVNEYVERANRTFFAPRGLRVSLRSLPSVIELSNIPAERGQKDGAIANVIASGTDAEKRAASLHPWIEALDTNVPSPNSRTLLLSDMGHSLQVQGSDDRTSSHTTSHLLRESSTSFSQDVHDDPPHSIPEQTEETNQNYRARGRGCQARRGRGRGAPNMAHPPSPFGPFGRGPLGFPGPALLNPLHQDSFDPPGYRQGGPTQHGRGHPGQGNTGWGSTQGNEWAALGQGIGKWGEEFGRTMGKWGEQFGKQAGAWGQDVGKNAEAWGEQVAATASGSGLQPRNRPEPVATATQTRDDLPPSYEERSVGQESGILNSDGKVEADKLPSTKGIAKSPMDRADDGDDASSISSDTSDSDTDSDSEDEEIPDTNAVFLKRVQSINKQAELAAKKGKKSAQEVAGERATAIGKAQHEKTVMDLKIEDRASRRAAQRQIRQRNRDLKKQHRQRKRELRTAYVGKKKGKAKKSTEWRDVKREYQEKKKELRKEKMAAKKEWRDAKSDRRRMRKERRSSQATIDDPANRMVWVVVENVDI